MIKFFSMLWALLLLPALLFLFSTNVAASSVIYSYRKIEKLYTRGEYDEVLKKIRELEKKRFGEEGKLKFSLRNDIKYYHYKLSSRLKLNRMGSLREAVGLYDRLLTLDSTEQYLHEPQYEAFRMQIKNAAETTLKKNEIAMTRRLADVSARYGDTTWVYKSVYPKKKALQLANGMDIGEYLMKYDYSDIDKKAIEVKKQSSIENQAWALTKDYSYDFEKARAIYAWIVHHIEYDYSYRIYDGETTFRTGTGVCSGFSYLFKEMCLKAGVKAYRVTGIANNGTWSPHAWNMIELEGQPFLLDSTWASCVKSYLDIDFFYMVEEKHFAKTHKAEEVK